MKYFDLGTSLFDITERYPQTLNIFVAHGFGQLAEESKRQTFGKMLQLGIALSMRQIDAVSFVELLEKTIEGTGAGSSDDNGNGEILRIKGLLPCPVRIPLQEGLDAFLNELRSEGATIETALKSASMGLDWIKDEVKAARNADDLDDLYISAGFDMFFEDAYFGRFIKENKFHNPLKWKSINVSFDQSLQLADHQNRYGIIAVVPAVFLVNTAILGDRPVPMSWKQLLDPLYEKSISLPVSDFDLFNAILLTIKKHYGMEAVAALGRNMLQSMHPAQMVKSENKKENRPAVTIMPNFFTKMVKEGSSMKAVWPSDGAIISPIFMIGKTDEKANLDAVSDFIGGKTVAEILSHQGLFPSLNPEVDNNLAANTKFMWLGWDTINEGNLNQAFDACHAVFNENQL